MDGIGGFFRYAEMRRDGRSDEEILFEMARKAEEDLERKAERVNGILRNAFEARGVDGESLLGEMEKAVDITAPAKARIKASKKDHKKLQAKISEAAEILMKLQGQMEVARARKDLLSKKLNYLTGQLNSATGEPKWMIPGTLEELRARGRAYGDNCSRF